MNGWIGLTIVGRRCSMHKIKQIFGENVEDIRRILVDGVWYDIHHIQFFLDNSPYVVLQKRIYFMARLQDDQSSKGKKTKNKGSRRVTGSLDNLTMIQVRYS